MKFKLNDLVSIKEVDDYGTIKYKGIIKSIIGDYHLQNKLSYVYIEITDICHKRSRRYPTRMGVRVELGEWYQFVLGDLKLELQEMRDNKLTELGL